MVKLTMCNCIDVSQVSKDCQKKPTVHVEVGYHIIDDVISTIHIPTQHHGTGRHICDLENRR